MREVLDRQTSDDLVLVALQFLKKLSVFQDAGRPPRACGPVRE